MDYDYTQAGFDEFLSRSIDDNVQANLDSPAPPSNQIRYDSTQVSGMLGDTLRVGRIYINGAEENIILSDEQNERLLIGRHDGGF